MPGSIDGLGLLKASKSLHPNLPVLITSGHCAPDIALDGGAAQFIPKPYDMVAVVRLVGQMLRISD